MKLKNLLEDAFTKQYGKVKAKWIKKKEDYVDVDFTMAGLSVNIRFENDDEDEKSEFFKNVKKLEKHIMKYITDSMKRNHKDEDMTFGELSDKIIDDISEVRDFGIRITGR